MYYSTQFFSIPHSEMASLQIESRPQYHHFLSEGGFLQEVLFLKSFDHVIEYHIFIVFTTLTIDRVYPHAYSSCVTACNFLISDSEITNSFTSFLALA